MMAKQVLFDGSSDYGRYRIIDMIYNDRPARMLFGSGNSSQSGIARDDEPELLFDYNQRFLEIAFSIQPRRVLVIGGGAFTLPRAILERLDVVRVDVVELDPLLEQLARRYFGLPDDPRLGVTIDDGRHYIDMAIAEYDLIVVDAFSGYDIPRSLLTEQAAAHYARLLAPGGVIALNFISRYHTMKPQLTHQLSAGFSTAFGDVQFYPADPHYDKRAEQNMLLVASLSELPSLDYLQSSPVALPRPAVAGDALTDTSSFGV